MSTLVVKVCEACGEQFSQRSAWLVVDALDIKRGGTAETLLHVEDEMDFCSPGCLLRYVSRNVEHAMAHHDSHVSDDLHDQHGSGAERQVA
jgi:hypothetical protein